MKTKCPLPKAFSGTKAFVGILTSLLMLSLAAAPAAVAAPYAFVSRFIPSGTVSMIDAGASCPAGPCVVATWSVGSFPAGVAVNAAGTRAYVANNGDGTVSVIDFGNPNVLESIPVGATPWGVAVADDGKVYVTLNNAIAVIDVNGVGTDKNKVNTIPVGGNLNGIAVVGSRAFVADSSNGNLVVIDGASPPTATIPLGNNGLNAAPFGVVADSVRQRVYVVHLFDSPTHTHLQVSAFNTSTLALTGVYTIEEDTAATPMGLAVSPDGDRLYVANNTLGAEELTVYTISTGAIDHVKGIGAGPIGVATNFPTGTHVFVANFDGKNVSVVDTTSSAVCLPPAAAAPCVVKNVPLNTMTIAFGAFATDGPMYALTLAPTPPEGGSIAANTAGPYPAGAPVTVTVTKVNPGFQFVSWSSNPNNASCSGAVVSCKVTMNADTTVTATFTPVYSLTLASTPTAGGSIAADTAGPYPAGNIVTVKVTKVNPGFQFVEWSSDPTNATCSGSMDLCKVTMNAKTTVTAKFTPVYSLTLAPTAGGSIAADTAGPYPAGNIVTVRVTTVNAGFQFSGWSSNPANASCTGAVVLCQVTMNADTNVTATFTQQQYTLTTSTTGDGAIDPAAGSFRSGSLVTLKAKPNMNSRFSSWGDDCRGVTTDTCDLMMNGPKKVSATFTATPPPPAPTACDDKIRDLEKKVAPDKAPWRHNHQLKAALRLYRAAQVELENAKNKVGGNDKRYLRAMSEYNKGKGALCNGHYWNAHHELWESYYIAHEILKPHRR
jgi:YVTN family beta-propeller protein